MSRPGKKKRKQAAAKKKAKRVVQANVHGAKEDMRRKGHDAAWGTSPGSLGAVKAASEEAKLVTCPDCGFSRGRHARSCALAFRYP